jgi:hypothetical protein
MPRRRLSIWPLFLALATAGAGPRAVSAAGPTKPQESPPARAPTFERDVRPLLQAKCWRCHGEKARKADLDLRTHAGAL